MSNEGQSRNLDLDHSVGDLNSTEHEIPDDVPFTYSGILDHAPETSRDGLEPLDEYREGGYHPIHVGDTLGMSGRYRIIHKLGHGGFATVWLCRDSQDSGHVAVKVMAAHVTAESVRDLTLMELDRSAPGGEYIAVPQDSFSITGPNGTHQCIVLPVLGPCVSPSLWLKLEKDPESILREMARQAATASATVISDFRSSNILVKLANLNCLREDELLLLLGQPKKTYVRTDSGPELPVSSPQYLTIPADLSQLGDNYLTNQICVIDFGESFLISSPPEDLGIPENYLPPEVLLGEEASSGPACDLWALGCTLFEIREQIPLFYMINGDDEVLAEIERFFGKLPQIWEFWLQDGDAKEEWSLEVVLSKPVGVVQRGQNDNSAATQRTLVTPKEEQESMADLLYTLFRYEPDKRPSVAEVLAHRWFKV
ncbi:kinase-like domain-containing protein [Xylariales sp. PMI_506]|nr:kinase-like domain-containing protein [Xylariales sp. PMI_506]